ncbi:MAG: nitrate reductase, partial [Gordonia sp. (in: high G+C Gram-positive bacteria)]
AIPLIIGIADFTWQIGDLTFTGISLGSVAALLVYHGMRLMKAARDAVGGDKIPSGP